MKLYHLIWCIDGLLMTRKSWGICGYRLCKKCWYWKDTFWVYCLDLQFVRRLLYNL